MQPSAALCQERISRRTSLQAGVSKRAANRLHRQHTRAINRTHRQALRDLGNR